HRVLTPRKIVRPTLRADPVRQLTAATRNAGPLGACRLADVTRLARNPQIAAGGGSSKAAITDARSGETRASSITVRRISPAPSPPQPTFRCERGGRSAIGSPIALRGALGQTP